MILVDERPVLAYRYKIEKNPRIVRRNSSKEHDRGKLYLKNIEQFCKLTS